MSPPSPLVALDGVSRTFSNGTRALDRLSLSVAEGEFVSLLGPSGCGKSTALRLIAGLGTPTSGSVSLGTTEKRDIGFVFQDPTLMPWATVADNVHLPLKLAGQSRSEAAASIAEVIARVGLEGFEGAYPRELSGGMKMRVSIARALVTKPRLLLMDEPFAALDEITRFRLNDDLLALWGDGGLTVIFVTHSVYESVYLSSRICVMTARPGRLAADIPVDAPHPRTEAFRTSAAYNDLCRTVSGALSEAMS